MSVYHQIKQYIRVGRKYITIATQPITIIHVIIHRINTLMELLPLRASIVAALRAILIVMKLVIVNICS
uniref:Uncharacterized protein n=1 Tax=Acrobeloides nanus TaxID=290746 RepID=A0A914DYJ2_9BILA